MAAPMALRSAMSRKTSRSDRRCAANCLPHLADRFFVLNGDTLFDVNLAALETTSDQNVIALKTVPDMSRYGGVDVHEGMVTRFVEKGQAGPGSINGGVLS